ncbi:MAG: tRNA (adenosine(37)-N6)-threonylcarbamoyltransferase complex dimerization subunit type 1 TsaB [Candidatus Omnitrophota bacterium]|jgi:tRNA threonylcarbamoyladenosine biosynthesis protein TsaB
MRTLAFDTSTKFLTIAFLEEEKVKAEFHEDVGIGHSELLMPQIKEMLGGLGWEIEDIALVCVGLGPGSFTGLRIAAATVKGLAAAMEKKVVGVPTMDAIVQNFPKEGKHLAPLLDARKGKVYSCIYDREGGETKRATDYMLVTVDELLSGLKEEVYFYGDGVEKYEEKLKDHPLAKYSKDVDWYPKAAQIGKIGIKRSLYISDNPETLEPLYLHSKECNITQ